MQLVDMQGNEEPLNNRSEQQIKRKDASAMECCRSEGKISECLAMRDPEEAPSPKQGDFQKRVGLERSRR